MMLSLKMNRSLTLTLQLGLQTDGTACCPHKDMQTQTRVCEVEMMAVLGLWMYLQVK